MIRSTFFIKAALCSLLFLSLIISSYGQKDTLETYMTVELSKVDGKLYDTSFDSVMKHLEALSNLARQNEIWDQYINVILYQAYASEYHGEIDRYFQYLNIGYETINQYEQELKVLDPTSSVQASLYYAQGFGYYLVGDMNNAVESYQLAADKASNGKDSLLLFDTYTQLGLCHFNRLDFENAILNYDFAQRWLPMGAANYGERGRQYQLAYLERAKGRTFYAKGKLIRSEEDKNGALNLYRTALRRLTTKEKRGSVANLLSKVYKQLAQYHLQENNLDSAQYYGEKVLATVVSSDAEGATNMLFVGQLFLQGGKYKTAWQLFEQAHRNAESNYRGKHYQKAQALHHLGQWHADQHQWESAIDYYQRAMEQLATNFHAQQDIYENPDLEEIVLHKEYLEVLLLKANALLRWHHGNLDHQSLLGAIDTYQTAMATIDHMRRGFLLSESRQFLSAKSVSIYEQSLEACYFAYEKGQGEAYVDIAFQTMELHKSNLLLEAVQDAAAKTYAGVDEKLIKKEQAFKSKISYLKRQISRQKGDNPKETNQLKKELFTAQQGYQQLIMQLETDYVKYFELKYHKLPVSLGALQKELNRDQAVIEFFYGDSSLFILGISKMEIVFNKIKLGSDLEQVLVSYIKRNQHYDYGIKPEPESTFVDDGYILYQQLLAPTLSSLGSEIKRLQVIPDGMLGYLPFDILLTESYSHNKVAYKSLPFLIKNYTIGTEFSATLWQNPSSYLESRSYPYLGFAPSFEGPALAPGRLAIRGGGEYNLAPLGFNQMEVVEAQKLFGGKAFLGSAATEADFKKYAPQSKILHLSTHAFARDQQVQYSGLVFSQSDDSSDEENDGYIYLDELYNMKLTSELAVLSACQTAMGELVRGEGIMSLGRAFKYAGCPNIVMSLWSVPDQSTSQIMKYFYQELKKGSGKAEALRSAKLRYLDQADANTADPFYWAAFTLIGDDLPLSGSDDSTGNILLILVGLIGLALVSYWMRKKFKVGS